MSGDKDALCVSVCVSVCIYNKIIMRNIPLRLLALSFCATK